MASNILQIHNRIEFRQWLTSPFAALKTSILVVTSISRSSIVAFLKFIYLPASELISSTIFAGFMVISTHAGTNPLFTAFLADLIFDHAEQ